MVHRPHIQHRLQLEEDARVKKVDMLVLVDKGMETVDNALPFLIRHLSTFPSPLESHLFDLGYRAPVDLTRIEGIRPELDPNPGFLGKTQGHSFSSSLQKQEFPYNKSLHPTTASLHSLLKPIRSLQNCIRTLVLLKIFVHDRGRIYKALLP
ncbi:hypothetical protein Tco_0882314 [Tanacetum coccineum]